MEYLGINSPHRIILCDFFSLINKMRYLEGITPRDYQQKIFETCAGKNCLVVLPTGLGKTLIALMLAIRRIEEFPDEKIVFLAPTRPLAEQHFNYFKKHLPELFAQMELFTGKIPAKKRREIWQNANIIFSTPQCVANDLRNKLYDLKEVSLLIEDEAHRCVKNYDYTYTAKEYKKQAKHPRILGLTASPGSELSKIKEICRNLSTEEVELRTRENDDVKKYLQELKFEKIGINFPKEFSEMRYVLLDIFNRYIEELKLRKVFFGIPSKINLINLQKQISATLSRGNKNFNYMFGASACAQAVKIQHALELLETQTLESFNRYLKELMNQASKKKSRGVVKLVEKPEFNFVFMKSNELLAKKIEHPKIKKLIEVIEDEKSKNQKIKIIVFTQFRDTAKIIADKINKRGLLKAEVFVGQAKKINVGGSTGLTQKEQRKIIDDFSRGKIEILCATSIAEEGLDIPEVDAVIFYEPVPSAIRTIQRTGRTARLMKGKLIVLITKKTRDESFFYVSRSREKKMHSVIKDIREDLNNGQKFEVQKRLK